MTTRGRKSVKAHTEHCSSLLGIVAELSIICLTGVIAFLLFTRKIPIIQDEIPVLNYYCVPLLVRNYSLFMLQFSIFFTYKSCLFRWYFDWLFFRSLTDSNIRFLFDCAQLFQHLCNVRGHVVPLFL